MVWRGTGHPGAWMLAAEGCPGTATAGRHQLGGGMGGAWSGLNFEAILRVNGAGRANDQSGLFITTEGALDSGKVRGLLRWTGRVSG